MVKNTLYDRYYESVIHEYNNILCEKQKRFSNSCSLSKDAVIAILRFAFSYYLRWSPANVRDRISWKILKQLELESVVKKYFEAPSEANSNRNLYYLVCEMYPECFKYDTREAILYAYRNSLKSSKQNLSKNFFNDDDAIDRACICLQDVLQRIETRNIAGLYEFFSTKDGEQFLTDVKLREVCKAYFDSPVHFLHEALPDNMKNDLLLNLYTFKKQYRF